MKSYPQQKNRAVYLWCLFFVVLLVIIIVLVCVLPKNEKDLSTRPPESFQYKEENVVQSGDLIHLSFTDDHGKRQWSTACSWRRNKNPGKDSALYIIAPEKSGPITYGDNKIYFGYKNDLNQMARVSAFRNPHSPKPGKNSVFQITKPGGGVIESMNQINLVCVQTGEVIYGKGLDVLADYPRRYEFTITKT